VHRRRRAGALALIVALAAGTWVAVRQVSGSGSRHPSAHIEVLVTPSAPPLTRAPQSSTTSATTPDASGPVVPAAPAETLRTGSVGDDVVRLQRRLNELGFVVGEPDGEFGPSTEYAVWAFKKLVLATPSEALASDAAASDVTPQLWEAILAADPPSGRRRNSGIHAEVYVPEQVLAIFDRGRPVAVAHMSSGDGTRWCGEVTYETDSGGVALDPPISRRECGVGATPGGAFDVDRIAAGATSTPIGAVIDAVFFNHAISIHGAPSVPLTPSTRGGIIVSALAAGVVSQVLEPGAPVLVWGDDGRDPEEYTPADSLPAFNTLAPECLIGLYTLRDGDTRTLVAAKFDITEVELNGANVATDGYLEFAAGLQIIIPPTDCAPATDGAAG
jgi:hypothetical protein